MTTTEYKYTNRMRIITLQRRRHRKCKIEDFRSIHSDSSSGMEVLVRPAPHDSRPAQRRSIDRKTHWLIAFGGELEPRTHDERLQQSIAHPRALDGQLAGWVEAPRGARHGDRR